jgi:hypothetical protein
MRAKAAFFAASVVSQMAANAIFLLSLGSAGSLQSAQTAKKNAADTSIVSAELTESRPAAAFRFYWRQPGSVSVTVRLRSGPSQPVERSWQNFQRNWQEISTAVASLGEQGIKSCNSFALRVIAADGVSRKWAWCSTSETKELKEVREMIENRAHAAYAEATAYLERGHSLISGRQFAAAVDSFKSGIQILGSSYLDPKTTVDDTGMKLVLARSRENEGKLDIASTIFERVLQTRLKLYASRYLDAAQPKQ